MNFYKHHLGDYDGATAHLSWDEDMAYTRLLRSYYRRERPLADTAEAYRLVRATSKGQRIAVDAVLKEFFTTADDGWHNKRADEEITAYQAQASTNKRIARERTVKRTVDDSLTKGSPATLQKREPNQEPLTKNQEPEESKPLASSASALSAPEPVNGYAGIPLADRTEFYPSEKFVTELEAAYPIVAPDQTLREIRMWCLANPMKCKTRKGAPKFISSWFARIQDHG